MAKSTGTPPAKKDQPKRLQAPGRTAQTREQKLTSLAYDLAEKRLKAGTATSQEVTHFLKMGSTQAKLELEKLAHENKLLEAKTETLISQKKVEELYAQALQAMRAYGGLDSGGEDDD